LRTISLPQMALMARQLVDIGGQQVAFGQNFNDNVTDQEITSYFNVAVPEIWSLLLSKSAANYSMLYYEFPITGGVTTYPLPSDFKSVIQVDVALDSSGTNFVTILPFNVHEQNIYSYLSASTFTYVPWSNIRYQVQGNNMMFIPNIGQLPGTIRMRYQQTAPILCYTLPSTYAINTAYAQGALVSVTLPMTGAPNTAQVFMALNSGTSGSVTPPGPVPGTCMDNNILWAYQGPLSIFATEFDGICGWEMLPILEVAIKIGIKQEMDVSQLMAQKAALIARIEPDADDRNSGDPNCISPGWGALEGGVNSGGWGGGGGFGW
jgi:hypothetical protein